jgi:RimJ/RimL family protein N-acetyltransferase
MVSVPPAATASEVVDKVPAPRKQLITILETERTVLRLFDADSGDEDFMIKLLNDPQVMAMMGDVKIRTHEDWAEKTAAMALDPELSNGWNTLTFYIMHLKDSNTEHGVGPPVGFVSLRQVYRLADFGYGLLPEAWGKGHATEGAKAFYEYVKRDMGLERFIGYTGPGHRTSMNILGKLGMIHLGQRVAPGRKKEDGSEMMMELFVVPGMEDAEVALEER